ncbi:MAG TPA: ABC transporter substrate-binding protein [Candidatus Lustribacter sp.]|nr:ABC transporter substrate-binding protein [Candidatus Lustribacter sp.]
MSTGSRRWRRPGPVPGRRWPRGRSLAPALAPALALLMVAGACTVVPRQTLPTDPAVRGRGGTLQVLSTGQMRSLDPQRLAPGPESSFATSTYLRTLTTRRPAPAGALGELVPDLAVGLGGSSDGGRSWVFPLRQDVPWQDGSQVTCEDFAYGISRAFGPRADSPGSRLVRALLDIPLQTTGAQAGQPVYGGPGGSAGQDELARAVSCDGPNLRIVLRRPVADLNELVTIPAFAPFKEQYDRGAEGDFIVFTCGAYMLEGNWHDDGGRFVRSRNFRLLTDPVRRVKPNAVELVQNLSPEEVTARLVAATSSSASPDTVDYGRRAAVMLEGLPAAAVHGFDPVGGDAALAAVRAATPSGGVDTLLVTATSGPLSTEPVRRALALATNREGYVEGSMGTLLPGYSLSALPQVLAPSTDSVGSGPAGNPAQARKVLAAARATLPVPVDLAYQAGDGADSRVMALVATWREAGFEVTPRALSLDGLRAAARSSTSGARPEVILTTTTPLWPSAEAAIAGVLDPAWAGERIAIPVELSVPTASPPVFAAALAEPDPGLRQSQWQAIESWALRSGLVIPVATQVGIRVHDPVIRGYLMDAFGVPSLAEIQLLPDETAAP